MQPFPCFVTVMSRKCIKISSGACLLIFIGGLVVLSISTPRPDRTHQRGSKTITITFSNPEIQCDLNDMSDGYTSFDDYTPKMKTPSLESFIRASKAMEDQDLRLSGLAVFSNLTDACQPLADVSKAKIQIHKIALIRLEN